MSAATDSLGLLTLDQVAELTHTPKNTIRFWIAQRRLSTVKLGRRRLVRRRDLEAFIEANTEEALS
jgi:excisionase family DNA binding protein